MARLLGIGVLLWLVYSSISYSVTNAPRPVEASVDETGASASNAAAEEPPDLVAFVDDAPAPSWVPTPPQPNGEGLRSGAYEVGDSPDPRVAARDRDNRPRQPLFDVDPDVETELSPSEFLVKGEIEPALYATEFGVGECDYELWRVNRKRRWAMIGADQLNDGRVLVAIDGIEPDWFVASPGCGDWYRWQPLPEPLTVADNGDYWVGDLTKGLWSVSDGCRWESVAGFRGARLTDVIDSGTAGSVLTVDDSVLGLRVRGCREPMALIVSADSGEVPGLR